MRNKIVVVMSTYNGEKYLCEQIESILKQEDVDVTLYIRDDGSSDQTCNILCKYLNKNNKIIVSFEKNIGWKKSFLKALADAPECEYYAFADQDDFWEPRKLIDGIEILRGYENDKPLLYISNAWITDENLNVIKIFQNKDINSNQLSPYKVWADPRIPGGCGQIFNRKAKDYALLMKEYPLGHDNLLERICGFMGNVYFDSRPHFMYRQHSANTIGATAISSSYKKRIKTILCKGYDKERTVAATVFKECYEKYLTVEEREFLYLCISTHNSLKSRIRLLFWENFKKDELTKTMILKFKILTNHY